MIVLAESPEEELDRLIAMTTGQAVRGCMSWFESDVWVIGRSKVQCCVRHRLWRGKWTFVATLKKDGRRIGKNALLWALRNEKYLLPVA